MRGMRGSLWERVVQCGARLKYIKNKVKLFYFKKRDKINHTKKESNKDEINTNKINRNKFGFPFYVDRKNRK
tara:strand:- start:314 stop:529 length:216 start_codon:yes stop_codon:yes gene_type:complete